MTWLTDVRAQIEPIDAQWMQLAQDRHLELTKPAGSLGVLEQVGPRLCGIARSLRPVVSRRCIVIFASDHGVTAAGVSPYPSEVTAQMVVNFLSGGAAINALATVARAELVVVDVGVATAYEMPATLAKGVTWRERRVALGTGDLSCGPAMTEEQLLRALAVGVGEARAAAESGIQMLGMGEMGIGNTTSAAVLTALLTQSDPVSVTGPGTGAVGAMLRNKQGVVADAVQRLRVSQADPLAWLVGAGGFELAAMTGLCLGAAMQRIPLLVDGFIAGVSAALAIELVPTVADYLFFSHRSSEPGHSVLLDWLGAAPLLDLRLRLGEGTGAALAMPIVEAAATVLTDMASFSSAGVSNRGQR